MFMIHAMIVSIGKHWKKCDMYSQFINDMLHTDWGVTCV